ncbi:hypothetical protein SPRG_16712 [Saprolegnia parasitica CBS 223.65]|uniref:Uncharacterized protein n=1 Tax=Saprolegnia parasitica (strain CBS 223.65) TaxID=695850 RepID=A0A067BHL3_SAPPC|nr:hypothetical protein SPRG_16712 [Saprolegnia parasitica CBS 223.65]KDO17884.1 hypothetical protein SPRG_16712 [Saprolegnia parasitica CBS 223.65]|eukprot:XP_012211411.1 hypothetical protein SPRG_16712 [Saprolegnia parasitica CBS 223.65]
MQQLGAPGRFDDEKLRSTLSTLVTGPALTFDGHRLRYPFTLRPTVWRHVLAVATKWQSDVLELYILTSVTLLDVHQAGLLGGASAGRMFRPSLH